MIKAACIQNCATPDIAHNLERCVRLVRRAAAAGANFIALPEYFSGLRVEGRKIIPVAYPEAGHPAFEAFTPLARELACNILLGSLGIAAPDGRIFNRAYMLDASGMISARYSKIHMFDVRLPGGAEIRESDTIAPGSEAVLAPVFDTLVGLTICYDLRFAGLYRSLAKAGASILAVPAAFTRVTGEAHWHVLNRARAIENGCFVVSPCQYGELSGGAECFGHSLIVAPWGEVLADGGSDEGVVMAELDLERVSQARSRIPSLSHDRDFVLETRPVAAE